MRRGLTMVELLVALSLLSAVMLAVASWTQVTARASADAAEPVRWRAAAENVLRLIHDDLVTGDFAGDSSAEGRGRTPSPRVEVFVGELRLRTRAAGAGAGAIGPVTRRYAFDALSDELRLHQATAQGISTTRLLLDRVEEWQCSIDEEEKLLTVGITSSDGTVVTRSYPL